MKPNAGGAALGGRPGLNAVILLHVLIDVSLLYV